MISRMISAALALVTLGSVAQASGVDVQQVRKTLLEKHATWEAKANHLTDKSVAELKGMLGYKRPANRDASFRIPHLVKTSDMVDWRNQSGLNWVSPVLDQGNCGSCVAFATVGTMETQVNIARKINWLNPRFSAQALFECGGGGCDMGWEPGRAAQFVVQKGLPDEACAPYTLGATGQDVACSSICADSAQRSQKASSYKALSGPDAIKAALAYGPVVTTMDVSADFIPYSSGIYKHTTGDVLGGHAISIVGYNDVDRYWVIRNSWATDWGEHGFANISYDDDSGVGNEGWTFSIPNTNGIVAFKDLTDDAYLSGSTSLAAQSTFNSATSMQLVLTSANSAKSTSRCDSGQACSFSIDSAKMADGRYEAQLQALSGNSILGTSEKKYFYILNGTPANLQVAVANSDGSVVGSKELSSRIEFAISLSSSPVPFNLVRVVIAQNGKVLKTNQTTLVAPQMAMGWRTDLMPNGVYDVHVEAELNVNGKVYSATTPVYHVTTKN